MADTTRKFIVVRNNEALFDSLEAAQNYIGTYFHDSKEWRAFEVIVSPVTEKIMAREAGFRAGVEHERSRLCQLLGFDGAGG